MPFTSRDDILSHGRVLRREHLAATPFWRSEVPPLVREGVAEGHSLLAIGLRRSYGDSNLNPEGAVIDMTRLDRIISFDPQTRLLRAEAGLTLDTVLEVLVPRGFFVPATPGTRYVTLGGAVANDVHGKNHHVNGTFGSWVRRLGLLRSDGSEHDLAPGDPSGLFEATIGGLGLTGIITFVEIEVMPIESALMEAEVLPFANLREFFDIARESEDTFDYTVSWIDCLARDENLGRGLFTRGRHAGAGALVADAAPPSISTPVEFPGFALNGLTVRAFNKLYYWNGCRKAGFGLQPYKPFFYPLDSIAHWNRMYGRRGMYQYQSAVPPENAYEATHDMLKAISDAGEGSFLAVLKTFGDKPSPGLLSFPRPGVTLALDFPNRGLSTLALMDRLDAIVREAKGRLYPAKDGRMSAEMFQLGYANWQDFLRFVDPHFSSHFWARVRIA